MGILDAARSALDSARRAVDTARRTAEGAGQVVKQAVQGVEQTVSSTATRAVNEVSGRVSSFGEQLSHPAMKGGLTAQVGAPVAQAVGNELLVAKMKGDPAAAAAELNKKLDDAYYWQSDDISFDVTSKMSDDELKKFAATPSGRDALEQMKKSMGEGWTTGSEKQQMDRIDTAIAAAATEAKEGAARERSDPNASMSTIPLEDDHGAGDLRPKSAAEQSADEHLDAVVADAAKRAKGSDAEVKELVTDTVAEASRLDPKRGGDLMARTADKLMSAGRTGEARELLQQLAKQPYAGTDANLVGRRAVGAGQMDLPNGNKIYLKLEGIPGTFGDIAKTRLAQCDQVDRMAKVLGKKPSEVNPYDLKQVRSYFEALRGSKPMKEVGAEYQQYLKNFAKHPGGTETTWKQSKTDLSDAGKMTEILKTQPRDAAGRMLLDCEATVYLTAAIFGKNPKNDVVITSDKTHISVTVFDAKTGEAFHVNTASKEGLVVDVRDKPPAKTPAERLARAWPYHAYNGKPKSNDFLPNQPSTPKDPWYAGRDVEQS